MFLRVFHFLISLLARCFPSAFEALKVIQEGSKTLPRAFPEGRKVGQEASKRLPRGAQDGPRRSGVKTRKNKVQLVPRGLSEAIDLDLYFGAQEPPKRHPRPPQEAPTRSPKGIQKARDKLGYDRRRYDILGYARIRWDMLGYARIRYKDMLGYA